MEESKSVDFPVQEKEIWLQKEEKYKEDEPNIPKSERMVSEYQVRMMRNLVRRKSLKRNTDGISKFTSKEPSFESKQRADSNELKENRGTGCELILFLGNFFNVFRIFNKIKKRAFYGSYKNLQAHHLNCINDASIILQFDRIFRFNRKSFFQDHWEKLSKIYSDMPMVDPNSLFKVFWDILVFVFFFVQIITYSIERSFDNKIFSAEIHQPLVITTIMLLLFDAVLSCNTKIFISGKPVKQRMAVFKHYMKFYCFIDVLTLFCLILNRSYYTYSEKSDLNLIFILKIVFCNPELGPRVRQYVLKLGNTAESLYDLITLGASILLAGHSIACLWHFIGNEYAKSNPLGGCWLKSRGIYNEKWQLKYLHSIYWSITTMLSVGYGDITPQNENEIIFTLVAMVYGCVVFGYSLSSVGEILERRTKLSDIYNKNREKANSLRMMARDMNLSFELESKIIRYMDYYWEQEKKVDPAQENLIMNQLSSALREQIYFETNVKYLSSIPVLRKTFSDKTLIDLAHKLKKIRCTPEEYIFKDKSDNCALYIVLDGNVQSCFDELLGCTTQNLHWDYYSKSDYFGIFEFFTGFQRKGGVISKDFSTLYTLSRDDFLSVIVQNAIEYEKFCQIRDDLILYGNQNVFEIKCASCGRLDHPTLECGFFKYKPKRSFVVAKYLQRWKNIRKSFKRSETRIKTNSLKSFGNLNETVNEFNRIQTEVKDSKSTSKLVNDSLSSVSESSLESIDFEKNQQIKSTQQHRRASLLNYNSKLSISATEEKENKSATSILQKKYALQNAQANRRHSVGDRKSLDLGSGLKNRRNSIHPTPADLRNPKNIFYYPLDRLRSYKYYYPKFNIERIIFKIRLKNRIRLIGGLKNNF